MIIQLIHDHCDETHLAEVVEEMKRLGAPVIRAIDVGDGLYVAIEGCHRIRAAKQLGLTPEIDEIEYDSDLPSDLDCDFDGTVADLVNEIRQSMTVGIEF